MRFSIIIPFYNAENYLSACLLSVINQTINFEENVNLILINDGSTDQSEEIAKKFQSQFPQNIIYRYTKNSGPAAARNKGMELIPTNTFYTTFLDADDMLAENALEKVELFFKSNLEVNVAALPVYYFEKKNTPIKLNNRFQNGTRVIDINTEYHSPQFYIGGVFLRNKILCNIRFEESLLFWEDALFINKIIVNEGKYGVVDSTKYFYRKRLTSDSLVDTAWYNKSRYTELIYNGYLELINYSTSLHKEIIPYVQYLIIYHLKLFVFQRNSKILLKVLSKTEQKHFIEAVKKLLMLINDKYIIEQDTKKLHRDFLLYFKKGTFETIEDNINIINKGTALKITRKKFKWFKLRIHGYFYDDNYMIKNTDKIFYQTLFKKRYARRIHLNKKVEIWGYVVRDLKNSGFYLEIPIWALVFRLGLESSNKTIYFKKINIPKVFFRKLLNVLSK